jgi:hypothetical protein
LSDTALKLLCGRLWDANRIAFIARNSIGRLYIEDKRPNSQGKIALWPMPEGFANCLRRDIPQLRLTLLSTYKGKDDETDRNAGYALRAARRDFAFARCSFRQQVRSHKKGRF